MAEPNWLVKCRNECINAIDSCVRHISMDELEKKHFCENMCRNAMNGSEESDIFIIDWKVVGKDMGELACMMWPFIPPKYLENRQNQKINTPPKGGVKSEISALLILSEHPFLSIGICLGAAGLIGFTLWGLRNFMFTRTLTTTQMSTTVLRSAVSVANDNAYALVA